MEQINAKQWLNIIGKEKLQAFQDNLAKTFSISLCFLDLFGEPLLVWSNLPLICDYMIKNNLERCMRERRKIIQVLRNTKDAYVHHCFMGLTFFGSPVYCRGQIVCVAYGGGAPAVGEEQFHGIINLLYDIFNMIHIGENAFAAANPESPLEAYLNARLSAREMEVAMLMLGKNSNRDIAQRLYISEKTVKTHVSHILRKLNLKDRRQLFALETDLLKGGM
jgi:DNA-binding CsgD family transcriptional regulator/ligand-binding sensor protein